VDLQAVQTSLDMLTKSPRKTLAHTRKDFHEELGLMFQVKVHTAKVLIAYQHIHTYILQGKI
jgi:hypothetical protein